MFMPKAHRLAIYEFLFKEGVMVVARDSRKPIHSEELQIPSLHIIHTMKSLKSKNFVREQYCWGFYYWFLTNEGIINLRQIINLATRSSACSVPRPLRSQGEPHSNNQRSANKDDRQSWRRHPPQAAKEKADDVGAGTGELKFRGGFSRGYRK
ncbi:40S ribosomal protein S10b-like [Anopheles aquasalis]|uniref:40S ribosomal protein S10b-like n=1 Tax=Anopheles aquasalis TaxID=42839 RepID=UPI00215A9AA7|nr:40S ribosomal protein S10b-like [Anopheles aquasalis]